MSEQYAEYEVDQTELTGNGRVDEDVLQIRLRPTEERLKGIKGRVYRKIQTDPDSQMRFIARFMVNAQGQYMDEDDALEILDELTMEEITETAEELGALLQDFAAPKARGRQSTERRISVTKG